jgi:hypothetical protein
VNRPRRIVWYPFLAACYPIAALAQSNGGELVRPGDLLKPFVIALCAAATAWLLSRLVTPDVDRRAFLAFVAVVIFSLFGYGVDWVRRLVPSYGAASAIVLLPLAVAAVLAWRGRVELGLLSRYLNLVLAILLIWTGATFLWRSRSTEKAIALQDPGMPVAHVPADVDSLPNLFLIILDKYTGHGSLKANYGLDNSPFEQALERDGFVVPRAARANYVHTFLALAAMLNWQYLDDVARQLGPENPSWAAAYPLIEDNRTWRALRGLGYQFVFMPSALPATDHNRHADLMLPDPSKLTHEFEAVWLRGTILLPILERTCALFGCSAGPLPYVPESAESLDWKFHVIPGLAKSDKAVFVLAHLTVPHEPYLYDAECRHRDPYWPRIDTGSEASAVKAAYIAQLQCVNRKVEQLVKEILSASHRPAIIMLQADHGHALLGRDVPPLTDASAAQVEERLDIFAAYRLPGAPPGLVYDSISPVNAMRGVMRHYFGLDLPPLADASYWSSARRPYKFTRVR